MTIWRQWLRDAAAHSIGYVASALVALALVPYLLRRLSFADYGVWLVSLAASATLGTLTIALWWTVSREVAGADEEDAARAAATVADALTITILIGVSGGLLLAAGGSAGWFGNAGTEEQRNVLRLAGAAFFCEQIAACASAVLVGQRRFLAINSVMLAFTLLRAASVVLVLERGGSLFLAALCQVAFTGGAAVALLTTMFLRAPHFRALRPVLPFSVLRTTLRFTSQLQVTTLIGAGMLQLVPLIVARLFGPAAVVPLSLGLRVPQAGLALAHRVGEAAYPLLVQMTGSRGVGGIGVADGVRRGTLLAFSLAVPVTLLLVWAAPLLMRAWLGTYPPDALVIFRLAMLGVMFEIVALPTAYACTAAGRTGVVLLVTCCAALVQLSCLIILLPAIGVRAAGVALLAACVVDVFAYGVAANRLGLARWKGSPA